MNTRLRKGLWLAFMLVNGILFAQNEARLLRYPDINKDLVCFVYAGDIWSVSAEGGEARRLTSHKGLELFPKISPDGRWIAFSAEYSGSRQIYVMPVQGGTPKQLTWYNDVGLMPPRGGFDNIVLDWTADSKKILIRSNRTPFGERMGKFYLVSIDGGLERPLQIPESGFGVLSPDQNNICYAAISREFRSWKRYKGGRAADLWIYDLQNDTSERITHFVGTDQIPTWYKDKIYFASDRDLRLNMYSYDIGTKEITQLTRFTDFDVMWPSGEHGSLVFENGGYLYRLNLESNKLDKIEISIHFDNPNVYSYYKNVSNQVHSFAVSPTAKRALFDARGDIFSVPAEHGVIYNLTQTQGIREIYPSWSPNGKWISYYSDKSGEYEIYLLENKKGAVAQAITANSHSWKYEPIWSPNSNYMLYSNRELDLILLNIATKQQIKIAKGLDQEIRHYNFSPDSKWITYTNNAENSQPAIWVYDIQNKQNHQITDGIFSDFYPVFSTDGHYIFFISNREFNLNFSAFEFNYIYDNASKIFAINLKVDGKELFPEKNDMELYEEASLAGNIKNKKDGKNKDKVDEVPDKVVIDFEGIEKRITAFPMEAGMFRGLAATEKGVLYINDNVLLEFDLDAKKSEKIISGVVDYKLSSSGEKLLYSDGRKYGIISKVPNQKDGEGKLSLEAMEMKIDPKKEWEQIYKDAWRIYRDYFYVENLHGVDWAGIGEKYKQLIPYVSHRADLDYVLSELVSETNTGHAYVNYGEFEKVKRIETGLLGAELKADEAHKRYRITKIFDHENWNSKRVNPLTEYGVNVHEGDYVISIDGKNVTSSENPYRFLENRVGKPTEIVVADAPGSGENRSYIIKPIASEGELRYLSWVNERRHLVDSLSGGKIGYIHLPNTAIEGNYELHRGMYAYHNKEALIIDDRYNGGGFIPFVMAELLDRETLSYWKRKDLRPFKTPGIAHDGPKVMLINHYSSSGGDCFPYFFRKKDLGLLIGTRTWGGLVGMTPNASLVDGGYVGVPRFGIFDETEEWIIEGVGVYPDIEVYDEPHKVVQGHDPSIEKAVEVLLKQLEAEKYKKPKEPADPDRSKWIEKDIK